MKQCLKKGNLITNQVFILAERNLVIFHREILREVIAIHLRDVLECKPSAGFLVGDFGEIGVITGEVSNDITSLVEDTFAVA